MKTKLIPLLLASLALFGPRHVFASDLSIAAAFYCDAEEMNESLVKECIAQYPNSAGRITAAWEQWRKRNQKDAIILRQQCADEINRQGQSQQQREQIKERLKLIKVDMLRSYPEMVKSQGESFCIGFLESGENDLSHLLKNDTPNPPLQPSR